MIYWATKHTVWKNFDKVAYTTSKKCDE